MDQQQPYTIQNNVPVAQLRTRRNVIDLASAEQYYPIKIKKGIPIPNPLGNNGKYPFRFMTPGDSFFAPGKHSSNIHPCIALRPGNENFVTRNVVENDVRGVRVWRIA